MSLYRRKRILVQGDSAVYHVMSRTACQAFLFGEEEKEVFCRLLRQQAAFAGVQVLTFCVMSNHIHLLLRVPVVDELPDGALLARYENYYGKERVPLSSYSVEELRRILAEGGREADGARERVLARMGDLPAFMRELKQRFSIWFNHRHGTKGTIWAARYKSVIVEDAPESLVRVAAYIDLNPVRAEIVSDPKDYRWCGYAAGLAGVRSARSGLVGLFANSRGYAEAIRSYRLILFGKGYGAKGAGSEDAGRISAERVEQIIRSRGKVPLQELLRVRVRYFGDGLALGSRAFMAQILRDHAEAFGRQRRQAGTPLPEAGDSFILHSFRDLRRRLYG
ncbi:MAG: transposase [Opitutales bacterium]